MDQLKTRFGIGLFVLLAGFAVSAQAAPALVTKTVTKGPAHKFGRGLVSIVTSPFQVPKEIIETASQADRAWLAPMEGMTLGLGKGIYNFSRRFAAGWLDLFTFGSPAERDWGPPFKVAPVLPEI